MTAQAGHNKFFYEILKGVAITLCIFGVSVSLSLMGFFMAIFLPLPILFYRLKLGRQAAVYIPIISFAVITLILGRLTFDSLLLAELMLMGFVMGEFLEAGYSLEKTFLYSCVTVFAAGLLFLFVYAESQNKGIIEIVSDHLYHNLQLTVKLYEEVGAIPQADIQHIKTALDRIHFILLRILPAITVSFSLIIMWLSFLSARKIAQIRQYPFPDFGQLKLWRAPEQLVWIVIGCGLMMLIPDISFKMIGANGLLILMTIYFFSGIAIVSFFFEKYRFPRPLRIFLYILIIFHQLTLIVVMGIGFFDIWINFRKNGLSVNQDN